MIVAHQFGTADDTRLVEWYAHLYATGDLATVFPQHMQSLSGFMAGFKNVDLVFALKDGQPWAAVWVEPMWKLHALGVWIAEPYRKSMRAGRFMALAHKQTLQAYGTLVSFTQNPDVIALATGLGYTNHGVVPGLCDGHPGTLLSCTKEVLNGKRRRRHHPSTAYAGA